MIKKIKICIADDNANVVDNMAKCLSKNEIFEIVKVCRNGHEVIEEVLKTEIDILVVDMIMPMIDGIEVIEIIHQKVQEGIIKKKPGIIVVSAIAHDNFKFNIFENGVNYYMTKPIEYDKLEQRIIELYKGINELDNNDIEKIILAKLYELEIYSNLKGYKYMKEAIKMLIEKPTVMNNIRDEVYSVIAREEKTTTSIVEKAIGNATSRAWKYEKEKIVKLLKNGIYSKKKPPTKIILGGLAEEIRNSI